MPNSIFSSRAKGHTEQKDSRAVQHIRTLRPPGLEPGPQASSEWEACILPLFRISFQSLEACPGHPHLDYDRESILRLRCKLNIAVTPDQVFLEFRNSKVGLTTILFRMDKSRVARHAGDEFQPQA